MTLAVRDLGAWHGEGARRTEVFSGVSITLARGRVLGVVGPNGCGKTTLLRALAGVQRPLTGEVTLPGAEGGRPGRVAMVPQAYRESFFPWASLRFNLAMVGPGGTMRRADNGRAAERVAAALGIDLDLGLHPVECSSGMLQQAAIVRALAAGPDVLLADEPFSALDVEVAGRIRAGVRAAVVGGGVAAVLVLHDLESIVDLCDEVLVVPGKPWSTAERAGLWSAPVLKNHWRQVRSEAPSPATPFVELIARVLVPPRVDHAG